jgi:acylphosphatase
MCRVRRVHVSIDGRVQGVFFRVTCVERARGLGLAGWVRNTPDGRVEAEFEGGSKAVDQMVAWCHRGPPHADVHRIIIREIAATFESGFRAAR